MAFGPIYRPLYWAEQLSRKGEMSQGACWCPSGVADNIEVLVGGALGDERDCARPPGPCCCCAGLAGLVSCV